MGKQALSKNPATALGGNLKTLIPEKKSKAILAKVRIWGVPPFSTGMLSNNHEMLYPTAQTKDKFSKGLGKISEQETYLLKTNILMVC